MIWLYILIFIISCLILFWAGNILIKALIRLARFLGWKEFVVAFFVMAFAGSAPNLFVGITSAIHKIPQFSLGDVVGGNIVDLTLAFALAILIGKTTLPAPSRVVQTTTIFTTIISLLPLLLISDGILSQIDGFILLLVFFTYIGWLFSKEDRFKLIYDHVKLGIAEGFRESVQDIGKIILALILLILASQGIVVSAKYFVDIFNLTIPMVGILIVGLGNALPEIYFAISAAKQKETWMVLGNLMGAIIIPATLVLGIVALISPIEVFDFSPFIISLFFLVISAFFFLFIVRSGEKVTRKEAIFLLLFYILFVLFQILFAR